MIRTWDQFTGQLDFLWKYLNVIYFSAPRHIPFRGKNIYTKLEAEDPNARGSFKGGCFALERPQRKVLKNPSNLDLQV